MLTEETSMDDNVSLNSSDSLTTSGEYEIVPETPIKMEKESKSPTLNVPNNGGFLDIKKDMTEVINELDKDEDTKMFTDGMSMDHEFEIIHPDMSFEMPILSISKGGLSNLQKDIADAVKETANYIRKTVVKPSKTLTLPLPSTSNALPLTTPRSASTVSIGKASTQSDIISPKSDLSTPDVNKVGQSIFYDCIDLSPASIEKQDDMKPEKSDTDEEISDIDQGCTIFSGVTYLGSVNINTPKSETEIQRNLSELNSVSNSGGLRVSVSIPTSSEGFIILHDAETNSVVSSFEVQRILFYARGPIASNEQACFAFTWSHGISQESTVFQCHVFRCHIPEAVNQVSSCFSKAFQRYPTSLTGSITSAVENNVMIGSITSDLSGNPLNFADYEFVVSLEIREKVAKHSYSAVPRDRSIFKLRCNTDKEVCITVTQSPSKTLQPLFIERCFGVLLSPGKLVRQADMQLLDMVSMGYQTADNPIAQPLVPYQIKAEWKSNEKAFEQLNYESQKMFLTVAVDLVLKGIEEPVRFVIETPVTIQSQNEIRIMDHFISKRSMILKFYLQLKKADDLNWKVNSINPSDEIVEPQTQTAFLKFGINNLSKIVRSSSSVSLEQDDCPTDYSSDGDEPLLSGTGEVSKDCSQDTLDEWDPVLKEWDGEKRPKNLPSLVRLGIPEALRGKIWQKLSNVENKLDMTDKYRTLITKETKCEAVIQRDIHRTFPAHKRFKETGGSGQDALFKVSKAYAVYDSEVGYCQGLSFIAASLLLHMPEEDAFCVLVALMYDYGLRDLYKQGFEALYMRLFQLNRLIRDHLPKLYEHFEKLGVETHMFASQWFLTLFTARFPLYFVFHVLDVFLLDGTPILFQVAITLLSICETDLRQLDFEGILKYFRVTLPKKCRSSSQARKVMKMACERKVKKLKQYEEEFYLNKKNEERLEREERYYATKFNDERKKFQHDIKQLQQQLEQGNEKAKQDEKMHSNIVHDYKQIIQRQELQISKLNEMLEVITKTVSKCQKCSSTITPNSPLQKAFPTILQGNNRAEEASLGPLDPINVAQQRIRELELELAQTKLAHVEAECKNQDLNHQLNTTLTEIQSSRGSWQPWISKTINSIQKVTARRDGPTFQSYMVPEVGNQEKQHPRETSPKTRINKTQSLNRNTIDYQSEIDNFVHRNISDKQQDRENLPRTQTKELRNINTDFLKKTDSPLQENMSENQDRENLSRYCNKSHSLSSTNVEFLSKNDHPLLRDMLGTNSMK